VKVYSETRKSKPFYRRIPKQEDLIHKFKEAREAKKPVQQLKYFVLGSIHPKAIVFPLALNIILSIISNIITVPKNALDSLNPDEIMLHETEKVEETSRFSLIDTFKTFCILLFSAIGSSFIHDISFSKENFNKKEILNSAKKIPLKSLIQFSLIGTVASEVVKFLHHHLLEIFDREFIDKKNKFIKLRKRSNEITVQMLKSADPDLMRRLTLEVPKLVEKLSPSFKNDLKRLKRGIPNNNEFAQKVSEMIGKEINTENITKMTRRMKPEELIELLIINKELSEIAKSIKIDEVSQNFWKSLGLEIGLGMLSIFTSYRLTKNTPVLSALVTEELFEGFKELFEGFKELFKILETDALLMLEMNKILMTSDLENATTKFYQTKS